jgi:hypothetical protein
MTLPLKKSMRFANKTYLGWAVCLPLICICGCLNPSRKFLKSDYQEYDTLYAKANDEQMLQNLARLANDDPFYLMQLSSINSEYQTTLSAGVSPSNVRNHPGTIPTGGTITTGSLPPSGADTVTHNFTEFTKDAFTLGGSVNSGITETPSFQFVPVTGSNVLNAIFMPIPLNVFYTFYDRGYPADLLARTMIQSVAVASYKTNYPITSYSLNSLTNPWPDDSFPFNALSANRTHMYQSIQMPINRFTNYNAHGKPTMTTNLSLGLPNGLKSNLLTIPNAPPPDQALTEIRVPHRTTNYEYYVNNPQDPSYPKFLQFCEELRFAQQLHLLNVTSKSAEDMLVFSTTNAKLLDVALVTQSNLVVKYDTNSGITTVTKSQPATLSLVENKDSTYVTNQDVVSALLILDQVTPTICSSDSNATASANASAMVSKAVTNRTHKLASQFKDGYDLTMMTVEAAMYTAAKEESFFRRYQCHPLAYPKLYTNMDYHCSDRNRSPPESGPYAIVTVTETNQDLLASRACDVNVEKLTKALSRLQTYTNYLHGKAQGEPPLNAAAGAKLFNEMVQWNDTDAKAIFKDLLTNQIQAQAKTVVRKLVESGGVQMNMSGSPRVSSANGSTGPATLDAGNSHEYENSRFKGQSFKDALAEQDQRLVQSFAHSGNFDQASAKWLRDIATSENRSGLETLQKAVEKQITSESQELVQNGLQSDLARQQFLLTIALKDAVEPPITQYEFPVRPLLRLTFQRPDARPPSNKLVEITYAFGDRAKGQSKVYFIGDDDDCNDNRVVFTMLSYLVAQIGVSSQNLPVQQVIHLQ